MYSVKLKIQIEVCIIRPSDMADFFFPKNKYLKHLRRKRGYENPDLNMF